MRFITTTSLTKPFKKRVYDADEGQDAVVEEEKPTTSNKKLEDMTSEEIEQLLFPKVLFNLVHLNQHH